MIGSCRYECVMSRRCRSSSRGREPSLGFTESLAGSCTRPPWRNRSRQSPRTYLRPFSGFPACTCDSRTNRPCSGRAARWSPWRNCRNPLSRRSPATARLQPPPSSISCCLPPAHLGVSRCTSRITRGLSTPQICDKRRSHVCLPLPSSYLPARMAIVKTTRHHGQAPRLRPVTLLIRWRRATVPQLGQPPLTLWRWSRNEYEGLVRLGVFAGHPVELIAGQLVVAESQGS